jgi:hypothetical protein
MTFRIITETALVKRINRVLARERISLKKTGRPDQPYLFVDLPKRPEDDGRLVLVPQFQWVEGVQPSDRPRARPWSSRLRRSSGDMNLDALDYVAALVKLSNHELEGKTRVEPLNI